MKIELTYPNFKNSKLNKLKIMLHTHIKSITLVAFLLSAVICGIVNIAIGGKTWSLCVIGAELLFWRVILYKPIIENTFTRKITTLAIGATLYLILLNLIYHSNWIVLLIPFIYFSILIVNSAIFFIGFKKQKRNILPLFFMMLLSLSFFASSMIGILTTTLQMIVLGGCVLTFISFGLFLMKNQIKLELKKKFHTK